MVESSALVRFIVPRNRVRSAILALALRRVGRTLARILRIARQWRVLRSMLPMSLLFPFLVEFRELLRRFVVPSSLSCVGFVLSFC